MATKNRPQTPQPRVLSAEELSRAIERVGRRIMELKDFDGNSVSGRDDPRTRSIDNKIHSTVSEIFGEGTAEARNYTPIVSCSLPLSMLGERYSLQDVRRNVQENRDKALVVLEGLVDLLRERLEDQERTAAQSAGERPNAAVPTNEVFIVHGHDDAAKEAVARYVERLGLRPIILHEQPNAGQTIIEKLEAHLRVGFAVVLLTPDDVGASASAPEKLSYRARQNVVLELGIFLGRIGRGRVCALHKGQVELPSDVNGVLYVPLDEAGGWRLLLAREMKHAGLLIDMNRAM